MSLLMLLSGAIPSFSGTPTDAAAVTDGVTAVLTTAGGASLVSQTPGNSGTSTVTSQAIAGPPAPATFAVLLVGRTGGQSTGSLTGVTDTAGNTWAVATRGAGSGIANTRLEVWYCQDYTPATTVTFAGSAQASGWNLLGFTGLVNASALDVASPDNSVTASSTTVTTPSVTTTVSDLVIAAIEHGGTDGTPPGTPWTGLTGWTVNNTSGSGQAAYLTGAPAGTYSATFTMTTARQAGVIIAGFKEGAASAAATTTAVADTAAAADNVTAQTAYARSASDTAGATDAVVAQLSQPPLSTLVDDFSTANSLWTYGSGISLTGGQLNLTIDGAYGGTIISQGYYRAANSANHVQIVSSSTGAGYTDIYLGLDNGEANGTPPYRTISLDIENGSTITAYYFGTSGWETIGGTGYNSTAHRWLRLAHDGTNVLWQASPDGVAWTNIASRSAATMDTALFERARLLVGSGGDGGGTAVLDNVGIVPSGAALTASPSDAAAATDAAAAIQQSSRSPADSATGADAGAATQTLTRAAADSAAGGDAATGQQTLARAATDTAAATDAVTYTLGGAVTAADVAGVTDAVGSVQQTARSLADTAGAADAVSSQHGYGGAAADSAAAADAAATAAAAARQATDSAGATDAVLAQIVILATGADVAGATDALTATQGLDRTQADVAGATDAVVAVRAVGVTVADTGAATDATTPTQGLGRTAGDTAGAVDGVSAALVQLTSVTAGPDAAAVVDATRLDRATGSTDTAAATDAVAATLSRIVVIADGADATDGYGAALDLARLLADTAAATDAAQAARVSGDRLRITWGSLRTGHVTSSRRYGSATGTLRYGSSTGTLEAD